MLASAVIDLRNSFGAAFLGLLVNTMLFGVTLAQTWIYCWHYWNKDPKRLKILIAFITIVDTFHTSLCVYIIYWYLVLNFGNVENLDYSMWALDIQVNTSGFYISAVNFYYVRRIYVMNQSIILPIIIVGLILNGDILGIIIAIREIGIRRLSKFHTSPWMAHLGMAQAAVIEALIAAIMCWSLYHKKTGVARTDSVITILMAYTINSGLLISLLCVAMTVTFLVLPSSLVSYAIYWVICKCCVNSFLALLNGRGYLRGRSTADNPDSDNAINLSSIRISAPSEVYGARSGQTGVSVTVHCSTDSALDSSHNVGPTLEVPKPSNFGVDVGSFHDHGAT